MIRHSMTQLIYQMFQNLNIFISKKRSILLFCLCLFAITTVDAQIFNFGKEPPQSKRELFIQAARSYLGVPYLSGGITNKGFDCSGFVYRAALEGPEIDIPRTVISIYSKAEHIQDDARQPGDLLFFNTTGRLSHVGIYLGGGTFIHSASDGPRTGVIISNLSEEYWNNAYLYAGRILPQEDLIIPDQPEDSAPSVNPFPKAAWNGKGLGLRINCTGGLLWDMHPGVFPIRGGEINAEASWIKGLNAYPGVGAGLAWDVRSKSFSAPITGSLSFPNGFRFFIGTQLHMIAASSLNRRPQFPGIIGLSWNSNPAELFGEQIRFYQSAEYSWFPNETFGSGFRFNTGVTVFFEI